MNDEEIKAYRKALSARSRALQNHNRGEPAAMLEAVAAWCRENEVEYDGYGEGALLQGFERKVADLLGYPAARFMPSGTMAQLIALRLWCEEAGLDHFGMHPTSHLERHEHKSYTHLHNLRATLVGPANSPLLAEHLEAVPERIAVLLTELPIREAGGQLPSWEELEALKASAKAHGVKLHLDGARLWQCGAAYGRELEEICAGFDSCYVSFYKDIGALSGAMLLGPEAFIKSAAIWQRRCGGNLYTLIPNVASAAMLLDERLARMPDYRAHAVKLAAAIGAVPGVTVLPDPPDTNMFHVFLPMTPEAAASARDKVAEATGVYLFRGAREADVPGHSRFELGVGDASLLCSAQEVGEAFRMLVGLASA